MSDIVQKARDIDNETSRNTTVIIKHDLLRGLIAEIDRLARLVDEPPSMMIDHGSFNGAPKPGPLHEIVSLAKAREAKEGEGEPKS